MNFTSLFSILLLMSSCTWSDVYADVHQEGKQTSSSTPEGQSCKVLDKETDLTPGIAEKVTAMTSAAEQAKPARQESDGDVQHKNGCTVAEKVKKTNAVKKKRGVRKASSKSKRKPKPRKTGAFERMVKEKFDIALKLQGVERVVALDRILSKILSIVKVEYAQRVRIYEKIARRLRKEMIELYKHPISKVDRLKVEIIWDQLIQKELSFVMDTTNGLTDIEIGVHHVDSSKPNQGSGPADAADATGGAPRMSRLKRGLLIGGCLVLAVGAIGAVAVATTDIN